MFNKSIKRNRKYKKNLFREKFYTLTREIDNLQSEIDFLRKNRIQDNNEVKKKILDFVF